MNTQVLMTSITTLLTYMGLLMCHPTTWRSGYSPPPPVYLPGPQFCPDTGRTVCADVDYYPTERIYNLLTSTRSQIFNITSLFIDERAGDSEPNLSSLNIHPPYYQNVENHYSTHPTPGGRFSPAGNDRNRPQWTIAPNPWRQVVPKNSDVYDGSWRGTSGVQNQQSDAYVPVVPNSRVNHQLFANEDGLNFNKQSAESNHKLNTGRNARIDHPFMQQKRLSHNNDNINPFGKDHQTKNYDEQIPYLNQRLNDRQHLYSYQKKTYFNSNNGQEIMEPYRREVPPGTSQQRMESQISQLHYNRDREIFHENLPTLDPIPDTAKRARRNMDVEGACAVRSSFIPPRAALNDQSEWKYIVNVPERDQRFSQVVRVDLCLREGQPCSSKLSLPFGFMSRCRQKYIKKKLLSLNSDGQGTAEDNFFIPSCCVCEIVRADGNS